VYTDAKITREQANKLAELAQNGLALAISPVHTMFDGDTVFVMSTGEREADFNLLTVAVVQVVRESILKSVRS
jgi:L-aminopeptidase/D-esterase-like protein